MTQTWTRALVTGASSGIGLSFAHLLAASGTDLVLVARNSQRLQSLSSELVAAHGVNVEVVAADLSTTAGVETTIGWVESAPMIDLIVNNAGLGHVGDFVDQELAAHHEQIAVNIDALVALTYAGARHMEANGGGTVLNVSSIAGDLPGPKSAIYNATKSFVTSFSQSIHSEMSERGVTVSCLCPGLTRTEFQDRAGYDASDIPALLWQESDAVAQAGLDAAASGKAVVVSGAINKTWSRLIRSAPRSAGRLAADALNRK